MSQKTLEIVNGISQAAANAYDGALDDKGEPIKFGLKREEGHPVLDSRIMDGFKVRIDGNNLVVLYQSDVKLKEVHSGKFESEIESTLNDVVKFLKSEFKKITGKALTLTDQGEADILVQSTSRVRVFVNATKTYKIGNLENVSDRLEPSAEAPEERFKDFLSLGGLGSKAKNDTRKSE